ncbi:hypothetical protein FDP22_12730 [Paroceanicella profunda]|uniref:Uncharacterized protein n=1 Tax=Paroceanicella profunda TaxID=2579971 RepID=A0A5B8G1Y5_9RHOB|nr:hypothetical protein [Paroceanicella profunda]QDL92573.1 hypothetical protein FDP22_12730 [Paroceanicella profunda]
MQDLFSALARLLDGILAVTSFVFGLLAAIASPVTAANAVLDWTGRHAAAAGLAVVALTGLAVLLLRRRRARKARTSGNRPRLQP